MINNINHLEIFDSLLGLHHKNFGHALYCTKAEYAPLNLQMSRWIEWQSFYQAEFKSEEKKVANFISYLVIILDDRLTIMSLLNII